MGFILLIVVALFLVACFNQAPEPDVSKRRTTEKVGRSLGKAAKNFLDYGNDT